MANPEQGQSPLSQGTGQWLDFNLAIPDFLAPVRESIDNLAQLLIAVLNVLLTVLDIIKAFTSAFLDPLIALIEAILALIEQFINDLRNAGFYLHGDWYLLKDGPEFRNILGGFSAYERRMIQRLIDPRDPNRPDLSPASTVIGLFFYASADATSLMNLLNFIRGILALFGKEKNFRTRSLGTVTNLRVSYGFDGASENIIGGTKTLFDSMVERRDGTDGISQIGDPNLATIRWQLADPPGNFVSPVARLVPDNFLVEVSTDPNPYFLQYDLVPPGKQVVPPDPSGPEESPSRVRGLVVDEQGRTLQMSRGSDQFDAKGDFFPNLRDKGGVVTSAPRVFAFKNSADASPIRIDKPLKSGDREVLQKAFFFKGVDVGGITPGQFMSATLKLSDMPLRPTFNADGEIESAEETDTFYVRVRAVSRSVTNESPLQYVIDNPMFTSGVFPVVAKVAQTAGEATKLSLLDQGEASSQLKITFPNANTAAYLECVLAALYVLVLSRPDLQELLNEDGNPKEFDDEDAWSVYENKVTARTGLEDLAIKLLPQITGRKFDNSKFFTSESDPIKWRRKVANRCSAIVNRLYELNNPPPSVQKLVVDQCGPLLDFKLGDLVSDFDSPVAAAQKSRGVRSGVSDDSKDMTLVDAMQSEDAFGGIAANPNSVGTIESDLSDTKRGLKVDINHGDIPEPYSPAFYTTNNDAEQQRVAEERQLQLAAFDEQLRQLNDPSRDVNTAEDLIEIFNQEEDIEQQQASLQATFEAASGIQVRVVKGSVTEAPVIYVRRGRRITALTYCRNAFTPEMYTAAGLALGIAIGPVIDADGGWITARLGQLLPEIDTFLDEILAWVKALAAAIDSIAKAIRRFIEYLQARIIELQMLIQRINAILQNLLRLFTLLPSGSILPLVSQGTQGILSDLVTAQNKPFDTPSAYGGGAVVLASAGPLFPSFFLDIFAADG